MSTAPLRTAVRLPTPSSIKEMRTYRQQALRDGAYTSALSDHLVDKAVEHIAYYPELQTATLRALHTDPDPDLIAAMAEAVLKVIATPGEYPSDADRIRSIHAVNAALKAAVEHVDPQEVPF